MRTRTAPICTALAVALLREVHSMWHGQLATALGSHVPNQHPPAHDDGQIMRCSLVEAVIRLAAFLLLTALEFALVTVATLVVQWNDLSTLINFPEPIRAFVLPWPEPLRSVVYNYIVAFSLKATYIMTVGAAVALFGRAGGSFMAAWVTSSAQYSRCAFSYRARCSQERTCAGGACERRQDERNHTSTCAACDVHAAGVPQSRCILKCLQLARSPALSCCPGAATQSPHSDPHTPTEPADRALRVPRARAPPVRRLRWYNWQNLFCTTWWRLMLDPDCKDPTTAGKRYTHAGRRGIFLIGLFSVFALLQSLTGSLKGYNLTEEAFCITYSADETSRIKARRVGAEVIASLPIRHAVDFNFAVNVENFRNEATNYTSDVPSWFRACRRSSKRWKFGVLRDDLDPAADPFPARSGIRQPEYAQRSIYILAPPLGANNTVTELNVRPTGTCMLIAAPTAAGLRAAPAPDTLCAPAAHVVVNGR